MQRTKMDGALGIMPYHISTENLAIHGGATFTENRIINKRTTDVMIVHTVEFNLRL
jgi:hypothetical protein